MCSTDVVRPSFELDVNAIGLYTCIYIKNYR